MGEEDLELRIDEFPGITFEFECPTFQRKCTRCGEINDIPEHLMASQQCKSAFCKNRVYASDDAIPTVRKHYGHKITKLPRTYKTLQRS